MARNMEMDRRTIPTYIALRKFVGVCSLAILLFTDGRRARATDSTFLLKADSGNFGVYFPTYLANGFFSVYNSIRGTDPTHS
jgi:hypothetical protein